MVVLLTLHLKTCSLFVLFTSILASYGARCGQTLDNTIVVATAKVRHHAIMLRAFPHIDMP
jgi:hypothetical protein